MHAAGQGKKQRPGEGTGSRCAAPVFSWATVPASRAAPPPPCNTPCHHPPISAIFHDLPKKVSGFPNFCAIIEGAENTLYQEEVQHAQTVVATRPRSPVRHPRAGTAGRARGSHSGPRRRPDPEGASACVLRPPQDARSGPSGGRQRPAGPTALAREREVPLFSGKKDHLISDETNIPSLSTARAASARLRAGRTFVFGKKRSPHFRRNKHPPPGGDAARTICPATHSML
jgi:hypothetical protein